MIVPMNRHNVRVLMLSAVLLFDAPFASAAMVVGLGDGSSAKPSATAAEPPDVFRRLPIHTRGVAYLRDYKAAPWVETIFAAAGLAQPALLGLKPLLPDEALVALLDVGKGDHVVVLAGIKVGDIAAFWKAFPRVAQAAILHQQVALPATEPRGPVAIGAATAGFLAHGQGWIWFSNSEPGAQAAAAGTLAADAPLSASALSKWSCGRSGSDRQNSRLSTSRSVPAAAGPFGLLSRLSCCSRLSVLRKSTYCPWVISCLIQ
jgi:hypothetical protein